MMKAPTMVYKYPGKHKIHGDLFDYKVVDADAGEGKKSELDTALSEGWYKTTPQAKGGAAIPRVTREELESKAKELGIKFNTKTSNKKLNELIEAEL